MDNKYLDETIDPVQNVRNIDELFDLWRQAHNTEKDYEKTTVSGIERDSFIADGYIYKKDYNGILFILVESNILHYKNENEPAFKREQYRFYREFVENGKDNIPKQKEKMGRMACYILENNLNPCIDEIKNALKQSAFINLNKRGGDKKRNHQKLYAYVEKYSEFVKKQIMILKPKVIICLGTYHVVESFSLNKINNKHIPTINMWHTAYPMKGIEMRKECEIDKKVDAYMREFAKRMTNMGL